MAGPYTTSKLQLQAQVALLGGNSLVQAGLTAALNAALGYASGSASGQCDRFAAAAVSIAASGNVVLNFQDGSLLDPDGTPQVFARVLGLAVFLAPGGASGIKIGGASHPLAVVSDTAGALLTLNSTPGKGVLWSNLQGEPGVTVTGGANDSFKILNLDAAIAAAVTYFAWGRSA